MCWLFHQTKCIALELSSSNAFSGFLINGRPTAWVKFVSRSDRHYLHRSVFSQTFCDIETPRRKRPQLTHYRQNTSPSEANIPALARKCGFTSDLSSLRRYTRRTSGLRNFGLMDSCACGSCGEALFDQWLIPLGLSLLGGEETREWGRLASRGGTMTAGVQRQPAGILSVIRMLSQ